MQWQSVSICTTVDALKDGLESTITVLTVELELTRGGCTLPLFHFTSDCFTASCGEVSLATIRTWIVVQLTLRVLHHLKHKLGNDDPESWDPKEVSDKPKNYYNLYAFASYNPVFYWPAVGGHGKWDRTSHSTVWSKVGVVKGGSVIEAVQV